MPKPIETISFQLPAEIRHASADEFSSEAKLIYSQLCEEKWRIKTSGRNWIARVNLKDVEKAVGSRSQTIFNKISEVLAPRGLVIEQGHKEHWMWLTVTPPAGKWVTVEMVTLVAQWPTMRAATKLAHAELWKDHKQGTWDVTHSRMSGASQSGRGKKWINNLAEFGLIEIVEQSRGYSTIRGLDPVAAWERQLHRWEKELRAVAR